MRDKDREVAEIVEEAESTEKSDADGDDNEEGEKKIEEDADAAPKVAMAKI